MKKNKAIAGTRLITLKGISDMMADCELTRLMSLFANQDAEPLSKDQLSIIEYWLRDIHWKLIKPRYDPPRKAK